MILSIRLFTFHRPSQLFSLNLSVSYIIFFAFLSILIFKDYQYSDVFFKNGVEWIHSLLCFIMKSLANISLLLNSNSLLLIAIDQYLIVISPMKKILKKNFILCLGVFDIIFPLILSLLQIFMSYVCNFTSY